MTAHAAMQEGAANLAKRRCHTLPQTCLSCARIGSVGCVRARPGLRHHEVPDPDNRLTQVSRPLPAVLTAMPARVFASEVILIIRLPIRPSRLKVISMPAVLRNV